jgi:hypothetical protein
MMAISRIQPDLLIRSFDGSPLAVVEVRGGQNLSSDVATEVRRNMLASGLPSEIPYFLVVSQDFGYLWKRSEREAPDAPPTYVFPMDKVVARYSDREPGQRLYERELELLVLQWLTNLSTKPQQVMEEPEKTLALSGFNDAIKRGMVLIEEEL